MDEIIYSIKKAIRILEKRYGCRDFTAETDIWHIMYMHTTGEEKWQGVALLRSKRDGRVFLAIHRQGSTSGESWDIMEIVENSVP